MSDSEKKRSLDKSKTTLRDITGFKESEKAFSGLSMFVPVNGNVGADKNANLKPVFRDVPKFSIYDGDYLNSEKITAEDFYGFPDKSETVSKFFKFLFVNLPVVNYLFHKIRSSKFKKSLSELDSLNKDVDKLASFFEGKNLINDKKYQKICEELVKANTIQSEIKKDITI